MPAEDLRIGHSYILDTKPVNHPGSVTGKTVCLINNDATSQSSKNKKAKELGVRIVSEETFMEEYLNTTGILS